MDTRQAQKRLDRIEREYAGDLFAMPSLLKAERADLLAFLSHRTVQYRTMPRCSEQAQRLVRTA